MLMIVIMLIFFNSLPVSQVHANYISGTEVWRAPTVFYYGEFRAVRIRTDLKFHWSQPGSYRTIHKSINGGLRQNVGIPYNVLPIYFRWYDQNNNLIRNFTTFTSGSNIVPPGYTYWGGDNNTTFSLGGYRYTAKTQARYASGHTLPSLINFYVTYNIYW